MVKHVLYSILMMIFSIKYGYTLPLDYCLYPLITSDCHTKATPVFTYYKPGSRCEIELWRGCPTFNKFSDEYLCSHFCIGKLWGGIGYDEGRKEIIIEESVMDQCQIPMNQDDCGVKEKIKYTFTGSKCIKVPWKGCESPNSFDDEETCAKTCNIQTYGVDIKKQLEEMPIEDVKAVNNILDDIMEEDEAKIPIIQHLMHPIESAIEAHTTAVAETTRVIETTTELVTTTSQTVVPTQATEVTTQATEATTQATEATTLAKETIETTTSVSTVSTTEITTPGTTLTPEITTPHVGSVEETLTT